MQWSLNWYDLLYVYAIEYGYLVALIVTIALGVRDIVKRKLHTSTIIFLAITVLLYVMTVALGVSI